MTPAHEVAVRLLGSTFVAQTTSPAVTATIRRLWSPFVVTSPNDVDSTDATCVRLEGVDQSDQLATFAVVVNTAALDRAPYFAVHAAVVARGDTAIAMPATSGVGKSTLTAACLRVGFDYASDEALCLREADGLVVPYPRPIGLSPWSVRAVDAPTPGTVAGDELLFTPGDLGAQVATGSLRLRHVVFLDRHSDGDPEMQTASRHDAITRMLELSFNHYRRPASAVRTSAAAVAESAVWIFHYSQPGSAAEFLCRWIAAAG